MYETIRAYYFLALAEAAHGSKSNLVRIWDSCPIMCQALDKYGDPFDPPLPCGSIDLYLTPSNKTDELCLAHWQEKFGFQLMTFEELSHNCQVWIQLPGVRHWLNGPKAGKVERVEKNAESSQCACEVFIVTMEKLAHFLPHVFVRFFDQ